MRSNTTCWHGFPLEEAAAPDRPGYVVGLAPGCALCAADGWTTVAFKKEAPVEPLTP